MVNVCSAESLPYIKLRVRGPAVKIGKKIRGKAWSSKKVALHHRTRPIDTMWKSVGAATGQRTHTERRLHTHTEPFQSLFNQAPSLIERGASFTNCQVASHVGLLFNSNSEEVDEAQFKIIMGYIESGKAEGAKVLTGGSRVGDTGYFIEPTVFGDVQDDMKIAKEEIFGPVMSVLKFKTVDEVVQRANSSMYGLAAGIVTKDINVANTLARSIRAGTVWVNCYNVADPALPFGGYKMSGIGREEGIHAVLNYMQLKSVVFPLHDSPWL